MRLSLLMKLIEEEIGTEIFLRYSGISESTLREMRELEDKWAGGEPTCSLKEYAGYYNFCAEVSQAASLISETFKGVGVDPKKL